MEASQLKLAIDRRSDTAFTRQLDDFGYGLKQGIPIALGYVPVSFTFGLMAVSGGIPVWVAILISLTNLTSAGQFAGTNLIISGKPLFEIALTTFVINIRYLLMSLSLSQRIAPETSLLERCIMSFGITDETFTVASLERRDISFTYMLGLVVCPYWGWALGTAMGATICSVLPARIQNSMGIALYAMFIALIVPSSKKSKATMIITMVAIAISCLFTWAPYLKQISPGWSIVIATIAACLIGAILFPREDL
ncbi:MAG: AzlC family ABC transporter permease [Firmicutes bacterium]|nr:AzlC family ABC transporter permease [Bacillota bacterium]